MIKYQNKNEKGRRAREPVQVYLDPADQERLERLQGQLDSSKSDVLRKGLEALERAISDPEHHPALRIIGIAGGSDMPEGADHHEAGYDVAREHDRFLADAEEESWTGAGGGGGRGGGDRG
jgi:hypothetical protein